MPAGQGVLLLLAMLAISCWSLESDKAGLTLEEQRQLSDIQQVVGHDFHFRRHEWSFSAVKFQGLLHFMGPWRLVARLGGTYTVGGSVYYNKWSWEAALQTLSDLSLEMERYHRVYRLLAPNSTRSLRLRSLLQHRLPRAASDLADFLEFVPRFASTQSLHFDGFLAPSQGLHQLQGQHVCASESVGVSNSSSSSSISSISSSNNSSDLLQLAAKIVHNCSRVVQLLRFDSAKNKTAMATEMLLQLLPAYNRLSLMVWQQSPDCMNSSAADGDADAAANTGATSAAAAAAAAASAASPSAAAAATSDSGSPASASPTAGHATAADGELSLDAAAWRLSRQVLGHLLVVLREFNEASVLQDVSKGFSDQMLLNAQQQQTLSDFFCRVIAEDIDSGLEAHLESREMQELQRLLGTCHLGAAAVKSLGSAHHQLLELWQSLRRQISHEYSAFQQYSNRIPAILAAKSAMKVTLPLIAIVGACLNSVVLVFYARRAAARRQGRNLLIALLACSDTCILIVSLMVLFTDNYMQHDQSLKPSTVTDLWCKFHAYLLNLTVETSAFIVAILSFERFLAVLSYFRHSPNCKEVPLRQLSIMALCCFCFACIFNCMLIIGDELAAPARSTIGHQCVHYVRLKNFDSNLAFVTRVKPILNTLVRSLLPYTIVFALNLGTCCLLARKGTYFNLHRQDEERREQRGQQQQLQTAMGQLGLALGYLVLTAPAPVVYTMFMTAHADRLVVKLSNGLVDELDPAFREHWQRLGRLTVAQYVTEFVLLPLSASITFVVFFLTDIDFRQFLSDCFRWRRQEAGLQELTEAHDVHEHQQQQQQLQQQHQQQQCHQHGDWEQTEVI